MPDAWLTAAGRNLFRWYLSQFPLRDGKAFFYERFHASRTDGPVCRGPAGQGLPYEPGLSRSGTAEGVFLRALPREV